MRDHMERIVMVPFSFGCASNSSVSVGKSIDQPPIKMKIKMKKKKRVSEENLPHTRRKEEKERASRGRMRRRVKVLMGIPKAGMQRLIKGFKTFSLFFVYKEDDDEEDEKEREMEIGLPTDVKHVTHIGWDGSTTINPIKGWENLKAPEIMSFPSISLEQFEFAMNSQTAPPPPLTT